MRRRKRGAGGFRAERRVTAVTRTAALRTGGRSCKPASPIGSLGHSPHQAAHEYLQRDPGIQGLAGSQDLHGLLLQGGPRERLPADGPSMDDLSSSRGQPENSRRLLADASARCVRKLTIGHHYRLSDECIFTVVFFYLKEM
jgi:hypothetical protein